MTKELTASASWAMKIKVFAPTDNIVLTVGAKALPLRGSVVLTKLNELLDGNIFTDDARRFRVR